MKSLVIVESPAKAKTIEKYLGKDFKVLSSIGHIRSIAKKAKKGVEPIDTSNDFATIYEIDNDKRKIISQLKQAVKEADQVWLATDEDREGEAIAWHLCEVLGLDTTKTKRIVFNEITKSAIEEAIKNPRTVDMKLVEAQQARQILDRLVGFELSPVVWRKVPGGKSAGRVQSPAVRLLVEREDEIRNFKTKSDFKITAEVNKDKTNFTAEANKRFSDKQAAKEFLETLSTAKLTVTDISHKPATRNPQAPFTTSTLQQTANSRLGFSSKQTMNLAQKLYQAGKITYMRTDSMNLSGQIIKACQAFIVDNFGQKYSKIRNFKTKSSGAQEAHEAIRPTNISQEKVSSNPSEQKLYQLIRNRTLASQMAAAEFEKAEATIDLDNSPIKLVANGEVLTFDGFLKIYGKDREDNQLPELASGDKLGLISATAKQMFKKPPARYSDGSLVKKLEELGIGRPSTYASIIDTLLTRDYAKRGDSDGEPQDIIVLTLENGQIAENVVTEKTGSTKGKLVPLPIGELIAKFLTEHFDQIVDYDFTAKIENEFDDIARGELDRNLMLKRFYDPFHQTVLDAEDIKRAEVSGARKLGIDPKTKLPVIARMGRFGPMLQLGDTDNDEKPRFASLPKGKRLDNVTLDEALEILKLPRLVGKTRKQGLSQAGLDIKANIGRFGPYIQVDKTFVSIKPLDPLSITLEEAQELYEQKLQANADRIIADWDEIKIIRGPFGPYITNGKVNVKIPKSTDPTKITFEEAQEKIANYKPKAKRRTTKRKK